MATNVYRLRASASEVSEVKNALPDASMHGFTTPVMGIELLGRRPDWTSPLCEIGISRRSVYQMTASGEQARSEGNRARATELGMETCEWFGNVTSKSIDRFAGETVRKRARNLLAMNVPRGQAIRHGKRRKDP